MTTRKFAPASASGARVLAIVPGRFWISLRQRVISFTVRAIVASLLHGCECRVERRRQLIDVALRRDQRRAETDHVAEQTAFADEYSTLASLFEHLQHGAGRRF